MNLRVITLAPEDKYKTVPYVPEVCTEPKPEYKVPSLPKNDYYKKPTILEDNYKKVSYVRKVTSVPKVEYKVPSLPKNDFYKKLLSSPSPPPPYY
uniref:Uncharacterized protein n=1 Tax=Solanum lycopersicum TaxID=4081 RepID=A0A3Q7JWG1_SOLLC